jgi:hypothetical protein
MGIRTPDLLIANETLYQLSYTPKKSLQETTTDDFDRSQQKFTTPLDQEGWFSPFSGGEFFASAITLVTVDNNLLIVKGLGSVVMVLAQSC